MSGASSCFRYLGFPLAYSARQLCCRCQLRVVARGSSCPGLQYRGLRTRPHEQRPSSLDDHAVRHEEQFISDNGQGGQRELEYPTASEDALDDPGLSNTEGVSHNASPPDVYEPATSWDSLRTFKTTDLDEYARLQYKG